MARENPPFSFVRSPIETPVLISVSHAGRDYSPALRAAARLPVTALAQLEDPLVDRLVERGVAAGAGAVIAHAPRAEIDLNRALGDLDPEMVFPPSKASAPISRRASSGLGLIPARLAGHGAIWRGPLPVAEVERRIAQVHRPYHEAIAGELARLRGVFGIAILLDCHSMPRSGASAVVLGDRHGTSAADIFVDAVEAVWAASGFEASRNHPYAGGEIVARHGCPRDGIHALQLEIERSLYLAPDMRSAGPGFDRVAGIVASAVDALAETAAVWTLPLAAE